MTLGIDAATQWWSGRSARERGLLVLLGVVLFGLLAWYGVVSPLDRAADLSERHLARAAALLSEVETSRAAIGHMVVPTDASLEDVLTLSATEAGFVLEKHSEASARETMVQGRAAEPAALFAWIEMLRKNHGLTVTNFTAKREDDGGLRVQVVFMRGAS